MLAIQDTNEINFSGHEAASAASAWGATARHRVPRHRALVTEDRVAHPRRDCGHCRTGGRLRAHASESGGWRESREAQARRDARRHARAGAGSMACAAERTLPAPPWSPSSPIARATSMICSPPRGAGDVHLSCGPSTSSPGRRDQAFPGWPLRRRRGSVTVPAKPGRAERSARVAARLLEDRD